MTPSLSSLPTGRPRVCPAIPRSPGANRAERTGKVFRGPRWIRPGPTWLPVLAGLLAFVHLRAASETPSTPVVQFATNQVIADGTGAAQLTLKVSGLTRDDRSVTLRQISGERRDPGGGWLPLMTQQVWFGPGNPRLTTNVLIEGLSRDSTFTLESTELLVAPESVLSVRLPSPQFFINPDPFVAPWRWRSAPAPWRAASPGRVAVLTVRREGPGYLESYVPWHTEDGTARAGKDYVSTNGVLVFGPGEHEKELLVPILPDAALGTSFRVIFPNPGALFPAGASSEVRIARTVFFSASEFRSDASGRVRVEARLSHPMSQHTQWYLQDFALPFEAGTTNGILDLDHGPFASPVSVRLVSQWDSPLEVGYPFQATLLPPGWNPDDLKITLPSASAPRGQAVTFQISRTDRVAEPLRLRVTTVAESAVAGVDFTHIDREVTLVPGQRVFQVEVPTLDTATGGHVDRTFRLQVEGKNALVRVVGGGQGTIRARILKLGLAPEAKENQGSVWVGYEAHFSAFSYFTTDGSARAGRDYVAASGSISAAPSAMIAGGFEIRLLDDFEATGPRDFFLNVVIPGEAPITNRHQILILDNEIPNARDPGFHSPFFQTGHPEHVSALVRRDDSIVLVDPNSGELVFLAPDGRLVRRESRVRGLGYWELELIGETPQGELMTTAWRDDAFHLVVRGTEGPRWIRPDLPNGAMTVLQVTPRGSLLVGTENMITGSWLHQLGADGRREWSVHLGDPAWFYRFKGFLALDSTIRVLRAAEREPGVIDLRVRHCIPYEGSYGDCRESGAEIRDGVFMLQPAGDARGTWLGTDASGRKLFQRYPEWLRFAANGSVDATFASGVTSGMSYIGTQSDGSVIALEGALEKIESERVEPPRYWQGIRFVRLRPNAPQTSLFHVVPGEGSEFFTNAFVTVLRSGSVSTAASVRLRTIDGTAKAGSDYAARDVRVSFGPGESAAGVSVPLQRDWLREGIETFGVELLEPLGAELGRATEVVHVIDNDRQQPSLRIQRSSVGKPALVVQNPDLVPFEIQTSTNLLKWTSLRISSEASLTLPELMNDGPPRFYRLQPR